MKYPLLLAITIALAGCHEAKSPEQSYRPGESGTQPMSPAMAEALSDPSARFVTPDLALVYDDCGIVFERTSDGAWRAIRLDDGRSAEFRPGVETDADGWLRNSAFMVDGHGTPLERAALVKSEGSVSWYMLLLTTSTTSTPDTAWVVITPTLWQ